MSTYNVAVVGATGLVGQKIIEVLLERNFPIKHLTCLASARSARQQVQIGKKSYLVKELTPASFQDVDLVFFATKNLVAKKYAPLAVKAGAIVIDNSGAFRRDADKLLIVPEVNGHLINSQAQIISNPNCSTIQALLPLKAIDDLFKLARVNYTTYQAVSGSGRAGIASLAGDNKINNHSCYPHEIINNVLPHIDVFHDNGFSNEEMKMILETQKILAWPQLPISATCVRVPVKNGHGVSISATCEHDIDLARLRKALMAFPNIKVIDDLAHNQYPTPLQADGADGVLVGRLRVDLFDQKTLHLFCCADNLRKGAATNSVQIGQLLIERKLL